MSPFFCSKFSVCHLISRKHLPFSAHNERRKRKKIDFPSRANIFLSWTGHWTENYVRFSISHYWTQSQGKRWPPRQGLTVTLQKISPLSFLFKSFSHDSPPVIPGRRTRHSPGNVLFRADMSKRPGESAGIRNKAP